MKVYFVIRTNNVEHNDDDVSI